MPCSDTHFIPILDEIRARPDPEAPAEDHEPISENLCQSVAKKGRGWGGRRPSAGAPKGNLNGFRHGRNSRPHQQMAEALARIPEFQKALITTVAPRPRSPPALHWTSPAQQSNRCLPVHARRLAELVEDPALFPPACCLSMRRRAPAYSCTVTRVKPPSLR